MRELPDVITSILINHSANFFFVIRPLDYDGGRVRLSFVLRSEFAKTSHITSALGCALDCLARAVGYQALGYCATTESEVSFHDDALSLDGPQTFIAEAMLGLTDNNLATYTSSIHVQDGGRHKLIVNASGTLKRQHANNLRYIADWRQLKGACVG